MPCAHTVCVHLTKRSSCATPQSSLVAHWQALCCCQDLLPTSVRCLTPTYFSHEQLSKAQSSLHTRAHQLEGFSGAASCLAVHALVHAPRAHQHTARNHLIVLLLPPLLKRCTQARGAVQCSVAPGSSVCVCVGGGGGGASVVGQAWPLPCIHQGAEVAMAPCGEGSGGAWLAVLTLDKACVTQTYKVVPHGHQGHTH